MKFLFRAAALALFLTGAAQAAIEDIQFQNPEQQARYHHLIDLMRCPMCLNANLSGSDAPIAADLRNEIHTQILAGKSDAEIIEFMRARYGDFILYRPPLNGGTLLLWFGPLALLVLGFAVARRLVKQQQPTLTDATLSAAESAHLRDLLPDKESSQS
jgi:cytochrome c-type biogenesis protein CcmH